jgi:hypothetical protein
MAGATAMNRKRQCDQRRHIAWLRSLLILGSCAVGLGAVPIQSPSLSNSDTRTERTPLEKSRRTQEWYKRFPRNFDPNLAITVPVGLVNAVPPALREHCADLLQEREVIPLTSTQAKALGGREANSILDTEIANLKRSLQAFEEHPIRKNDGTVLGDDPSELKSQKSRRAGNIAHLRARIAQLAAWKDKMQPYLVKTVAFEPPGVVGGAVSKDMLVITAGILGHRAGMLRWWPVVVFSPAKPTRVYSAVDRVE